MRRALLLDRIAQVLEVHEYLPAISCPTCAEIGADVPHAVVELLDGETDTVPLSMLYATRLEDVSPM